jgi:hypothetical protein
MKTKYVWSKEDVQAGMIVCRAHRINGKWKPEGWCAKWTHKIGFAPGDNKGKLGAHYCQIAMTDGMVYARGLTKEQMAEKLTETDMIPMPWSWWLKLTRYLRTQTNPKMSNIKAEPPPVSGGEAQGKLSNEN